MKVYIYSIIKTVILLILFNNNVHSQGAVIHVISGETATMTASFAGSITSPVYRWYREPTGGPSFHTGATYTTTTAITSDTAFYVSVEGSNYCLGERLMVNVLTERTSVITVCHGETATLNASLAAAGIISNPAYKWYDKPSGGTLLSSNATFTTTTPLTTDTAFYVSVEGSDHCVSALLKVIVIVDACTADAIVCYGEKATVTASLEIANSLTNPIYRWYAAPNGGAPLYTGHTFTSASGLMSDTAFYVSVEGDGYCESPRRRVNVEVESCAAYEAEKSATLLPNTLPENGSYANPASILGNEVVKYEITTKNPTLANVSIIIVDTLPAYLEYVGTASSTPSVSVAETSTSPQPVRKVLTWRFPTVAPNAPVTVSFNARPESGAVASQPLFINRATVSIVRSPGDSTHIQTNGTFHQGAGISIMTFSAGLGGEIYNATEQALDYMSTPKAGIIIAPEEGYKFAGWSHRGYTSLRGAEIKAQSGIMHYDTLTVYGNVELHAEFVPVEVLLKEEQENVESEMPEDDKVWSVKDEMFIRTTTAGSIVRIYTTEGILREQRTIVAPGITTSKMLRGIYVVTINNAIGYKIRIE